MEHFEKKFLEDKELFKKILLIVNILFLEKPQSFRLLLTFIQNKKLITSHRKKKHYKDVQIVHRKQSTRRAKKLVFYII